MSEHNQESNGAFPNNEEIYRDIVKALDEVNLNSEVLVTIIKEFSRISQNANHGQIHVLANILQALLSNVAFAHEVIVMREGGHGHHGEQ